MRFLARLWRRPIIAAVACLILLLALSPPPQSSGSIGFIQTLEQIAYNSIAPSQDADAAAVSNYLQNKFIDWFFRAQTFTAPTTIYIALATSSSSASACGTEVSGGSYARVAVTSALANWAGTQSAGSTTASSGTSGQTSNNGAITFPSPTANWGTIVGFCAFDASSGGNLLFFAALTVSKTVNNGDAAPSFAAAALTYTLTELIRELLGSPTHIAALDLRVPSLVVIRPRVPANNELYKAAS